MPKSEALRRAQIKYQSGLDEIRLRTKKEHKDRIKAAADRAGESIAGYVLGAVDMRMKQEEEEQDAERQAAN